jgi:hypothetical protein
MVPRPRRRRTQQSANMISDKSVLFKVEDIIVFTFYLLCKGMTRRQCVVSMFACCDGCYWPILAGEKLR